MVSQTTKEFYLIKEWEINSPVINACIGTGRAKCRVCGEKIAKGVDCISFFHSFTDGGSYNPWTSIACKAHKACCPDTRIKS